MIWRPKDWEEKLQSAVDGATYSVGTPVFNWGLEIGADAMLEALKAEGMYVDRLAEGSTLLHKIPHPAGRMVFIPDEES